MIKKIGIKTCTASTCDDNNNKIIHEYEKGNLCCMCNLKFASNLYQKFMCEYCDTIHYIRRKDNVNEKDFLITGTCAWCKQRIIEEQKLIEDGILNKKDALKKSNRLKEINKIINKKE